VSSIPRSHLRRVESISGTVAKLTCIFRDSCGTVALMILGQLSDICGPTRSRFANIRKLTKDHKAYGSAANIGTEHLTISRWYVLLRARFFPHEHIIRLFLLRWKGSNISSNLWSYSFLLYIVKWNILSRKKNACIFTYYMHYFKYEFKSEMVKTFLHMIIPYLYI
jgi:hypothetical protein